MQQAGIAFVSEQIVDLLANGVNIVHVYSMNKPAVTKAILQNLSEILKYRRRCLLPRCHVAMRFAEQYAK